MLESLIFIVLVFLGVGSLIFSIFFILFALIKNEKYLIKGSFYSLAIPLFCFGLIFFFYSVIKPMSNYSQMEVYSGNYISEDGNFNMVLNSDGTYVSDSIPKLRIYRKGIWKTGGVDGYFEFYDNNGKGLSHVWPSSTKSNKRQLIFDISNKNSSRRKKIKFIKFN